MGDNLPIFPLLRRTVLLLMYRCCQERECEVIYTVSSDRKEWLDINLVLLCTHPTLMYTLYKVLWNKNALSKPSIIPAQVHTYPHVL